MNTETANYSSTAASTVLILGARGRFGLAAARAFANAGWRVLAHMRVGAEIPAEVRGDARLQWISHDLKDYAGLSQVAAGATVVVHALNPAYTNAAWRTKALAMLDSGIEVARVLGATVMFPGNIYNFGADMPRMLQEDTPQRALTVKGQIRIAMEAQLKRSGIRSVVIRAGDFFGSGSGTWFDQSMVKDLRKGVFTYPGQADIATAWAYLPDLAQTFVQVADRRGALAPFEVLHFAGTSISAQQWLDVLTPIARAQGWIPRNASVMLKGLPWGIIRIGGWFNPVWGALMEMRYLWGRPHLLVNTKLVALLGAEVHTPLVNATHQALVDLHFLPNPVAQKRSGRSVRTPVALS